MNAAVDPPYKRRCPSCRQPIRSDWFACPADWGRLPEIVKADVREFWDRFRDRPAEYARAMSAATLWLQAHPWGVS